MFKRGFKRKILPCTVVFSMAIALISSSTTEARMNHPTIEKVKNIVFMIPDGFSSSYATNYRLYKGEKSLMDSMLVGMSQTYSASSEVTDSAAAGTAMATGVKTNNGMISTSPDGAKLKTILEAAEEAGKSTGLVVTAPITHATPAVFASHVSSRTNEKEIAPQYIKNDVDVLLGGGMKYFPEPLLKCAKDKGYEIITDRKKLEEAGRRDKLIGLFANKGLAPELDRDETKEPSLAEMSKKALEILSKNKDGFFLMIEGSQIDWAGHAHDPVWAMNDIEAFENALKEVLEFAKRDKDTLVVIAGDHDTGGMSVGGYGQYDANLEILRNVTATGGFMASKLMTDRSNIKEVVKEYAKIDLTNVEVQKIKASQIPAIEINEVISKRALVGWTSYVHTGTDVPLYAFGPNSNLFSGLHNNIDLPKLMAKAMKINL